MNRPPTPAGPLFATRGPNNPRERSFTSETKSKPLGTNGIHPLTKQGIVAQQAARPATQTALYHPHNRAVVPGPRLRKPLGDITNGQGPRQQTDTGLQGSTRHARHDYDLSSRYPPHKLVLPPSNEHQDSGKGILKVNVEKIAIEPSKQVRFGFPGFSHCPAPPPTPQKTVKFNATDIPALHNRSPTLSGQSRTKEKPPTVPCEVTGRAIRENINMEVPSRRIKVVRRSANATAQAFSMFRRKLQQTLDMRYSSDTTVIPSECVIRRQEAGLRTLPHPPSPRISLPRQSFHPVKQTQRQTNVDKDATKSSPKVDKRADKRDDVLCQDNLGNKFSYRLAEKAEEYFTRNMRHLQENVSAKANVVETYVVEDDPKTILERMDKSSPVSLTTRNLEMHNTWLAKVDTKESYSQRVSAREKRIRRWIDEMQSSSRLNHMRVVNIVVKDRGYLVQNARDDTMDRMSQVPSQVQSQVMV